MHPIFYIVLSGVTLYVGAALIWIAIGLRAWTTRRSLGLVSLALVLIGAALMLISGAPVATWFAVFVGIMVLTWVAVDWLTGRSEKRLRGATRGAAAACLLVMVLIEVRYALPPRVPNRTFDRLIVIGDSVSAGFRSDKLLVWPDLVRQSSGVEVVNLARAGATLETAMDQQVPLVGDRSGLVLLEIGGNDMLYGHDLTRFETGLDRLVSSVKRGDRMLVMLELPTPPFDGGYATVQRRVARRHNVVLVPRRYFARVLGTPGGTLDGVHLAGPGHRAMADMVRSVVGRCLRPSDASPTSAPTH